MKKPQRGFTLIQVSILLVVASLVMVAILPSTRSTQTANQATVARMNKILSAMRAYESATASLPCPADANLAISGTYYGVAAANPGTTTNCSGGTPAANYTDTTNQVAIGMVPVHTLGLSNDYAQDAYGHHITYAVDTNATVCFQGTLAGQVKVTDNGVLTGSVAALISHGMDGHGAWVPLTGTGSGAARLNASSTDNDEHMVNAHGLSNGTFPTNYSVINSLVTSSESTTTTFVRKPPTGTFDDLVVYKSNLWNLNSAPADTSSIYPSLTTYPASGNYYTGQSLTFILTFPQAVTVTGTPEIAITMQSGTEYATYQSGTGTTALTFTYTPIKSTDYSYSPTGISVTSPVTLNGGSVTEGTDPACLSFTPPNLTGVQINPIFVYVTDLFNNTITKYNASGSYITTVVNSGQSGSSAPGGLNNPVGIAMDANGNLWVSDAGNWRVDKLTSSGSYLLSQGNGSHLNGKNYYWEPAGVAIDSGGDVWVADNANFWVQELVNSSGSWLQAIGGASPYTCETSPNTSSPSCPSGSGNGQFSNGPYDMAFDQSGNLWVADPGNNRVQEFRISGTSSTWMGSLGGTAGTCTTTCFCTSASCPVTAGGGKGQLNTPSSVAVDSSNNIWVCDQYNNRLEKFTNSGTYIAKYSGNCYDIHIDPSGNIWSANNSANSNGYFISKFNSSGSLILQFGTAGTGVGQYTSTQSLAIGKQ